MLPSFDDLASASGFRPDLARWRQLVQPRWLAQLLAGAAPCAPARPGWRLLEVGYGTRLAFEEGHIPGASYLDTADLEVAPLFNKVPDRVLRALLLALGIDHDTTVILYGRGSLAAARAAHLLLYAGVSDVRLLDGGLRAWRAAALPLACGPAAPVPVRDFGIAFPACPHLLVDMAEARRSLRAPDTSLVSIRTWSERCGQTSGYSYIQACGDIPGTLWGRAGREGDVHSMSQYQLADTTMRPAADIAALWHAAGMERAARTIFYCGTGWRASLAFFYAWLMGWDDIAVYDGGWYEWSGDPANPVRLHAAQAESA